MPDDSAIDIRRLGVDDGERARQLVSHFKGAARSIASMGHFLGRRANYLYGAFHEDDPAGIAIAYRLDRPDGDPDMVLLYEVEVAEAFRRRGLAGELLRQLREDAPGKLLVLTRATNDPAMTLYESAGGTRPHDDDVLFVFE